MKRTLCEEKQHLEVQHQLQRWVPGRSDPMCNILPAALNTDSYMYMFQSSERYMYKQQSKGILQYR